MEICCGEIMSKGKSSSNLEKAGMNFSLEAMDDKSKGGGIGGNEGGSNSGNGERNDGNIDDVVTVGGGSGSALGDGNDGTVRCGNPGFF